MFIRNLEFNTVNHYKCNKSIAQFLWDKGFSEISLDDDMYVFLKTEELKAALKIMPIHLKFIAKLGGDSNGK